MSKKNATSAQLAPRRPKRAGAPDFTLLRPICDTSIAQQLVESESKIDTSRVLDAVGDEGSMYATTTMRLYHDFARAWIWSPNHCESVCGDQPSGFQFNMSPQSPVYADPFSRRAMFNGLMAIPITDMPALSLRHFADPRNRVSERMLEEIANDADLGGPGDDTNFAGIFSTTTRDAHSETVTFWVATQSHSLTIAERAAELIVAAEPDTTELVCERSRELISIQNELRLEQYEQEFCTGTPATNTKISAARTPPFTTVTKLFFSDKEMVSLRAKQREHRATVLAKLMKAASLVSPRLGSSSAVDTCAKRILDARDLVEVTINDVDRVDKKDAFSDVVYMSNMASIYDISAAGLPMRDAPRLGLKILRGPWNVDAVSETQREADRPFISVPVTTGMRQSNALRYETASTSIASSVSSASEISGDVWHWTPPKSGDCHFLLDGENVRSRNADRQWLKFEHACGFPKSNETLHLSNVSIRLASPEHRQEHIKRFN
jgi:hypothetical protein